MNPLEGDCKRKFVWHCHFSRRVTEFRTYLTLPVYLVCLNESRNCLCCIFWPAFGCCALPILVKLCLFFSRNKTFHQHFGANKKKNLISVSVSNVICLFTIYFFARFYCKFLAFFFFYLYGVKKMLNKYNSISFFKAQHPNAVLNIQHACQ